MKSFRDVALSLFGHSMKSFSRFQDYENNLYINPSAGSVSWSTFSLRIFSKPKSLIEAFSVQLQRVKNFLSVPDFVAQ